MRSARGIPQHGRSDTVLNELVAQRAGAGPANPAAGAEERLPFTLSQLVAFCTLARAGSFRAAALALSVSQPAVSKSLALLEQVRPQTEKRSTGLHSTLSLREQAAVSKPVLC